MGRRREKHESDDAAALGDTFVSVCPDSGCLVVQDTPFYVCGANVPSLMLIAARPGTKRQVLALLDAVHKAGLTVLRVYAFADGKGGLQPSPGEYSEEVFRALDFCVHEARARGLRLLLVLTNYGPEAGGMRQYRRWSCARRGVEEDDSPEAFYDDPRCQDIFRCSLVKLIDRVNTFSGVAYRDDPTILGWSLANAPRCAGDYSGSRLHEWADATSEFIKSLDANHLVTMDVEGFLGGSSADFVKDNPFDAMHLGVDFFRSFTLPHVDVASCQCWPDEWLPEADEEALLRFSRRWIDVHVELCAELHKPLLLAAFGKKPAGPERAEFYTQVFGRLLEHASQHRPVAGGLFSCVAIPGWAEASPELQALREYHVFLDVPRPDERRRRSAAHSIRSFRSDDEGSSPDEASDGEAEHEPPPVAGSSEPGHLTPAVSSTTTSPRARPQRGAAGERPVPADDPNTVAAIVAAAADCKDALGGRGKDCTLM